MRSVPRKTKDLQSGFTLIELLAVIIILGILSAIVVYGVSAARDNAVAGACVSNVKIVTDAENAYYLKNGVFGELGDLYTAGLLQAGTGESLVTATDPVTYSVTNGVTTVTILGTVTATGNSCATATLP